VLGGCIGGCIDTPGWAELIANWPGERCSRPGRETRVSLCTVFLHAGDKKMQQLQLAEASLL
jgi:hypothetical protein